MFIAVRRASAIVDTIGLTPEQLGIPLASAIHTPVTSCSSPSVSYTHLTLPTIYSV